jgi:ATP-dependent DNA helicase RecQ
MKLIEELFLPSQFTLLTAPVAAGKTSMVMQFYREHSLKVIFVSPLRALANEVHKRLAESERNVFLAGEKTQLEPMLNFLQCKKGILVSTMELLSEDFLEACSLQHEKILFILDEFHLFYHWGESFRPVLHDRFLGILDTQAPVLGLTATMNKEMQGLLENDLQFHCEFWFYLDFGNHQLRNTPEKIHYYHPLKADLFHKNLWRELRMKETGASEVFLIFCSYRSEVDELVARSRRMGLVALGCVGGEVDVFLKELEMCHENIDCIFSTTTLSHGVNLPEIKKVFINYEVKNYDFWLQMIGRGGRLGSPYEAYTFDTFHSNKKELFKNYLQTYLADFVGL